MVSDGLEWENLEYRFVGTGEDCGQRGWGYRACPEKAHGQRYSMSCRQRDCQAHWRDWLSDEARAVADRVGYYMSHKRRAIRQHVVVDMSVYEVPKTTKERMRHHKMIISALKQCGVEGGALVCHPWRAHVPDEANDTNKGYHYHLIAIGRINPDAVKQIYQKSGILIIGFGRDRKTLKTRAEYMLSHCGLPYSFNRATIVKSKALHSVVYFGCVSYNQYALPEKMPECYCSVCKKSYPLSLWWKIIPLSDPPDTDTFDIDEQKWKFVRRFDDYTVD